MNKIKAFFFGRVYYFPLWLIYIFVGLTINCFSIYGINGRMPDMPQYDSEAAATVGIIIALLGVPGFSWFFTQLLFGWIKFKR